MNTEQKGIDRERMRDAIDRLAELSEILANYMLRSYSDKDWRGSPHIEPLAAAASSVEANGRDIPSSVRDVFQRARRKRAGPLTCG